jgi:Ca2+-binding EF-hand superfamily protein
MLTLESERRLKNVLVAIGDGERSLESSRQSLCRIDDFAPLSAHERLDRDSTGNLSSQEILNFLRENGISHVLESEARDLINFFDNNASGKLSSTEFT